MGKLAHVPTERNNRTNGSEDSQSSADSSALHRLWGNPVHLKHVSESLRAAYSADDLQILVAKSNTGNFTYDGIELGGERVTQEIENELEDLKARGKNITRFSMIGYSLGGLIARYAIGLLYSKGIFDKIQPINFTTFATPHLGVRTPLLGIKNQIWNAFGSRTLSTSGNQMFLTDTFRDTSRPLLEVLADPNSIFIRGLSLFKRRSLYANIINDRSVPYYTAGISATDPFVDMHAIDIDHIPNTDDILLEDPTTSVTPKAKRLTLSETISSDARAYLYRAPIFLLFTLMLPVGSALFLVNSGFQSYQSSRRIRLHEEGKAGIGAGAYRLPLMVENVRKRAEGVFENMNAAQQEEYLPEEVQPELHDEDDMDRVMKGANGHSKSTKLPKKNANGERRLEKVASMGSDGSTKRAFPLLALTPGQFDMVDSLNNVGFDKFGVHIHKCMHSHAAIIVRTTADRFTEGKVVVKHWVDAFEL